LICFPLDLLAVLLHILFDKNVEFASDHFNLDFVELFDRHVHRDFVYDHSYALGESTNFTGVVFGVLRDAAAQLYTVEFVDHAEIEREDPLVVEVDV